MIMRIVSVIACNWHNGNENEYLFIVVQNCSEIYNLVMLLSYVLEFWINYLTQSCGPLAKLVIII